MTFALTRSLRSLRSGESDRAGLRPALGPPTQRSWIGGHLPGGQCPPDPHGALPS
jgi:hypothetical protein